MSDEAKLLELFAESCREQLSGVEKALLDLETVPPGRRAAAVDAAFRAAHTIKGDAASLGARPLVDYCHGLETVLQAVREARIGVGPDLVGALLRAFDRLRGLVDAVSDLSGQDIGPDLAHFEALAKAGAENGPEPDPDPAPGTDTAGADDAVIRHLSIPAAELDILVDRVGELGIAQARLAALAQAGADRAYVEVAEEIERLAALLRDQVLGMRLLPLQVSFAKYRRLVRDACAELGKDAEFVMRGENVELDKTVIERLNAPFIHLLRNACDHGLERPDERRARGKPPRGRIVLAARQEGSEVVIDISDDGTGIDTDKLARKAVELGLIDPEAALSQEGKLDLIFLPGLSTSERVGRVSGRGVGMDAVRQGLAGLRGRIEVRSVYGQGTTFVLRLPISLAIIDCLRVRAAGEDFFVHLDYVEECLEAPPVGPGQTPPLSLDLRGELLPLIRPRQIFELAGPCAGREQAVVVRAGGRRFGLAVDEVVGRGQAVLKQFGPGIGKVEGVMGATVTESGAMALILDLPGLARLALDRARRTWSADF